MWAFISHQIPHMRQWGIILQITADLHLLNFAAQSFTMPLGITQETPINENSIFHSSLARGQCNSKWSIVSPSFLDMQHQSITTTWRFLKLLEVKILPKALVHRNERILKEYKSVKKNPWIPTLKISLNFFVLNVVFIKIW